MSAINARCGVSHQSIANGDACRVLFISQASSYAPLTLEGDGELHSVLGIASTTVYPNCFWRPDSGFFKVIYDDYAMSRLVLESNLDRSQVATYFADLWSSALRTQQGTNPYHDVPFDFPAFIQQEAPQLHALFEPRTWKSPPVMLTDKNVDEELHACWAYLCNMVRRHRVFVYGVNRHIRPLAMFIMHEQAYQGLLEYMQAQKDRDGNSYRLDAYLRHALTLANAAKEEALQGPNTGDANYMFGETLRSRRNAYDVDNMASNSMARYAFNVLTYALAEGKSSEEDFIKKGSKLLEERAVICALNAFDISFQPMTFVGADSKNAVGQAYTRFITDIRDKVTEQRQRMSDH